MPILFLIVADKIGLNVRLSTAPLHLMVRFIEDETGIEYNIEATSGGYFSRDEWYRKEMPMTEKAIKNSIYLSRLSKVESGATFLNLLGEHYLEIGKLELAIKTFESVLKYYPKSVFSMVKAGSGYFKLLERDFTSRYQKIGQIPLDKRETFEVYVAKNKHYFKKAESLGWKYLKIISKK